MIIKIINFRGDLSDISAKTATLVGSTRVFSIPYSMNVLQVNSDTANLDKMNFLKNDRVLRPPIPSCPVRETSI